MKASAAGRCRGEDGTAAETEADRQKAQAGTLSGRLHGLSPLEKISKRFWLSYRGGRKKGGIGRVGESGDHLLIRVLDGRIEAEVVKAEKSVYNKKDKKNGEPNG